MIKLFSFVQQGGEQVVTNSQRSSTKAQQSFPGATVTVYYTGGPQGLVTTNGVTVTWVQGTLFNANPGGWTGLPITINGTVYTISAVSSIDSLTLTSSAGVQAVPVAYSMGATTPAALYSDNTGTPRSNPYTSDSTTAQQFMYADNGTYDFHFSGTGISAPFTISAQSGIDPFTVPQSYSSRAYQIRGMNFFEACADVNERGLALAIDAIWDETTIPSSAECSATLMGGYPGGRIRPPAGVTVSFTGNVFAPLEVPLYDAANFDGTNYSFSFPNGAPAVFGPTQFGFSTSAAAEENHGAFLAAYNALPETTGSLKTTVSGKPIRSGAMQIAASTTPYVTLPILMSGGVAVTGVPGANGGSPIVTIQLALGTATSGAEVFTVAIDPTNDGGASPDETFGTVFENICIDANGGALYGNNLSASGLLYYGAQMSKLNSPQIINCGMRGLVIGANGANGSGFFDAPQIYVAGVTKGPALQVDSNVGTFGNVTLIDANPSGNYGNADPAVFVGTGLNDAMSGGSATTLAGASHTYAVTISATGTPDHFTWTVDGGSSSAPTAITGAAQALSNGVTITFAATTGHTLADQWTIQLDPTPAFESTGIQNTFDNVTVEQSWLPVEFNGAGVNTITNLQISPGGSGRPIGALIKNGAFGNNIENGLNFAESPNVYINALVDRVAVYVIPGNGNFLPFSYAQTNAETIFSGGITIVGPQDSNVLGGINFSKQYTNGGGTVETSTWSILHDLASGSTPSSDILQVNPPQNSPVTPIFNFAGPLGTATNSSGNFNSVTTQWVATYWTGSAAAQAEMAAQLQLGTGATPTVALVFAGAPGIAVVAAPVLRLTGEYTYAALTAAFPSPPLGMQVVISDSTTNAWGANITTGGGGDVVLAWYNGTNFTVIGK